MEVRSFLNLFYTVPFSSNIKKGELLSQNIQVSYDKNISKLLQDAEVFGLGLLGDGATIKQMPLLNILVLCGSVPPTVVSMVYCTTHMSSLQKSRMCPEVPRSRNFCLLSEMKH